MGTRFFISSLSEVSDWMSLAIRAGFKVKRLAKLLGCKPRKLRKFFRLVHECTVKHWLRRLRRVATERLLRQRQYSIGDIVGMLSYRDRAHLAREFKRMHRGQTASQWRNVHARRWAVGELVAA